MLLRSPAGKFTSVGTSQSPPLHPVCIYMREEVICIHVDPEPFETRTEVRDYIQGMDQTADYWVRTARSLQRIALIGDE